MADKFVIISTCKDTHQLEISTNLNRGWIATEIAKFVNQINDILCISKLAHTQLLMDQQFLVSGVSIALTLANTPYQTKRSLLDDHITVKL